VKNPGNLHDEPPLTLEELEMLRRIADEARAFRDTALPAPMAIDAGIPPTDGEPVHSPKLKRIRCATGLARSQVPSPPRIPTD
jgi:hypothetical protein